MSKLTFYTNPQSRGRIVHWMLEETGVPYETVWLDFGTSMKSPEYLAINPMGKVPAIRHGDAVVTEAPAICAYLADRFPEKDLLPAADNQSRAAYYRWLFFAAGPIEAAVTSRAFGWQVPEGKNGVAGFGSYKETIDAVERAVAAGPYICGDKFTAADVYVGSSLGWGMMFGAIEKRPAFESYIGRLHERPAFRRSVQLNEARLKGVAS